MRFKWKPQWLNSCHTEPQIDIQFQSKPAQISTANQHLSSELSQLLDHYAPLEWSQFPVNGIHAFAKRGSERLGSPKKKREKLISHSPPKTFHCTYSYQKQSSFCLGSLRLTECCSCPEAGHWEPPCLLTHTYTITYKEMFTFKWLRKFFFF